VSRFRLRARLGFSIPLPLSGPRGITPAFGYGAPHPSARGTSTPLNNALLSAHYADVRLLADVPPADPVRRFAQQNREERGEGKPVLIDRNGEERLYFVVETKNSQYADDLRDKERAKIACGERHFEELARDENPARFIKATSLDDVLLS
jgi:hypothetical protein